MVQDKIHECPSAQTETTPLVIYVSSEKGLPPSSFSANIQTLDDQREREEVWEKDETGSEENRQTVLSPHRLLLRSKEEKGRRPQFSLFFSVKKKTGSSYETGRVRNFPFLRSALLLPPAANIGGRKEGRTPAPVFSLSAGALELYLQRRKGLNQRRRGCWNSVN